MWQILWIFVAISFANCDTDCPNFDKFVHKPELLDQLNGEYMMVYTSSSYVLGCERIKWTVGTNNNRTANLKDSAGCCRRIDNFDNSDPKYIEHDITPTSQCTRLPSTERVVQKILAYTGTGPDLCLIVYVCHPSRNGLLVKCRQQPSLSVWIAIGEVIGSLLELLGIATTFFKTVNQYQCIFLGNCVF